MLHFEPDLDYQQDAINAVVGLFRGQEISQSEFTVSRTFGAGQASMLGGMFEDEGLGIGNRLLLLPDDLLKNLQEVQLRNGLRASDDLDNRDFTIEMETGTGKTYVYLRTIFKLHEEYGFTKFVIVVPSIAIKEGVFATLQSVAEHLRALHGNIPFSQGNNYFLYDSSRLPQVRNFATDSGVQVMVVTVGAINKKDVNNLYKESEKTGDERPIDLIRATNPIVIVDEPQSVDGGLSGAGKQALDAMNPLCTLRYSATHVDKHHMVYRLDSVDAYERQLVKQIEVASATIEDAHNRPYVRFIEASNKPREVSARVELDIETGAGVVRRQEITVRDGDHLEDTTKRALYRDVRIGEIRTAKGKQLLELRVPGGEEYLQPSEASGAIDPLTIERQLIRRTIKEHLDKELRLRPQGIKVLSLFFIPRVDLYRKYDEDGHQVKGEYAHIFEEEYSRLAKHPDYQTLFEGVDLSHTAEEVHDGYFSIDRKGGWQESGEDAESNQTKRANAERAYNLIMREKGQLLRFETPLKFIFSHSALREGWDNPNVFQICALRDIQTQRERRQTIGRGLRLCVNQHGDRLHGFELNTLTVIATERYEDFAENLQRQIEDETGIRFGIVERHEFATVTVVRADGTTTPLGFDQSKVLWEHLKATSYIDGAGKVQDTLRTALRDGTVDIPPAFEPQRGQVVDILRHLARRLEVKDADERRTVRTRRAVLHSEEFRALWDRIKHKTTYRVDFDNEALLKECTRALKEAPAVSKSRLQWEKGVLTQGRGGIGTEEAMGDYTVTLDEGDIALPDVLSTLQDRTQLTRRSIHRILTTSGRLGDFKTNPQEFIEIASEAINRRKRTALVDGIKYQRLGDEQYYAQALFESRELSGYLKNMLNAQKSVYEQVVFDSPGIEQTFAQDLEKNEAVKVYAKLPAWFTVPTPLGNYNPDWAVLIDQNGEERLYFVVETKGSLFTDDLRVGEEAKIRYGRAHFEALAVGDAPARYEVASTLDQLLARL